MKLFTSQPSLIRFLCLLATTLATYGSASASPLGNQHDGHGHSIAAQLEIMDLPACYAEAVDTIGNNPDSSENADLAIEILAECTTDNFEAFLSTPDGGRIPLGGPGASNFLAFVSAFFDGFGFVSTQHLIGNMRVEIFGDEAQVSSYVLASHYRQDGRVLLTPVVYEDEVVKVNGQWLLSQRLVKPLEIWAVDGFLTSLSDPNLGPINGGD